MAQYSTTLSSVGNSSAIALNWRGGWSAHVSVTAKASTDTSDFTVQYTFDDVNSTSYSTGTVSWLNVSSAPFTSPAIQGIHYTSSTIWPDGIFYPGTIGCVAGLRLNSTAITGTLTLKVLQSEGI